MTNFRAGMSDGPPKVAHRFVTGSSIRLSQSTPQSRRYHLIYMLTPSPCFPPNSSWENAFSFTSPQHTGQSRGIFTCGCRTCARDASPARRHLRLPHGVKRCRRHCVKGEGFFFSPLNESNLINITIRSLVWKQCRAKFSNCSLCHITLGTFARGAHLAPPALTLPSTPSIHAGTQHQWSAGLIGTLKTIKPIKSSIHRRVFGKPARS